MGRNSKIEIVRTSENIKQADLYKKPGTNTFFICLNERYMNQIKEYSSPYNTHYDPQFFIKFSDREVAELIGTFNCKLECSSDAFKIDYYGKKTISSNNCKDKPTVYMDSEILLQFDIPYKKFEEAKEYLRTHNNTVKITFVEKKEEKKEMDSLIGFKETKFDYNSITIEADIGIENFFINNDRLTDRFNEHDNRLMPASIDLNLIIKDDKLVDKYLHINKEAIVRNYDNNIPSTVKISRFAYMGNYNFILTIETADMNYDKITNYINSHNGKFIITLNFNDNDIGELMSKVEDEIDTDQNVLNDIAKKTPLCPTLSLEVEREWSNGVKCTYIETEVEITADKFYIYDDSMQLVPFKSSTGYHRPIMNPFIKFDDETYNVFVKYLNDNDYKLLIRHNCGPTIEFDYMIIVLIGNNTFVVNMMQFSNHPVSYEIFKDYLESHNNKLELTFNFIKKNEECV